MGIWNDLEKSNLYYQADAKSKYESVEKLRNKNIIIYGYGTIGIGVEKICENLGLPIAAVCDKNKIGQTYKNGIIEDMKMALSRISNVIVIVCIRGLSDLIREQYKEYVPVDDFIDGDDFYHDTPSYFVMANEKSIYANILENYRRLFEKRDKELKQVIDGLNDKKSVDTLLNRFKYLITYNKYYIAEVYDPCQYFPKDIVQLTQNEVFLDCGAYDGDTLRQFLEETEGQFDKVYCFEPAGEACYRLEKMINDLGIAEKVKAFPIGIYDKKGTVYFSESGTSSRITESSGMTFIETDAIDNIDIEDISFIKMDIEGAELAALKGAEKTIRKYKPKLAICIYHKPEDVIDIPLYIMSLGLDYKYYIRQHFIGQTETVFYAL